MAYFGGINHVALGMSGAIFARLSLGTVDIGNVIVNNVVGNSVFELRVLSCLELVGPRDLQRYTAAIARSAELLSVLAACLDLDRPSGALKDVRSGAIWMGDCKIVHSGRHSKARRQQSSGWQ